MSKIARPHEYGIQKNRARPLVSEPRRHECPRHLDFIRSLPSVLSGSEVGIEPHHLLRVPTNERGGAMKSGDRWAIPLTWKEHKALHDDGNEIRFLARHGIYGPAVAALLWALSGNPEQAERAIAQILEVSRKVTV